ncbi:coiled-coil-helix-coiled-coil-helix domain containing 3a isoform X2 [Hippoglossus stenolepis]|uniref:coiled-coil-helix-coiled-coil-helix domain containing 3a isoform X2 n=1 Tax=Hippoglossus stenolepis TaxID=195615 RepID=UPI00159C750F|nr:coiled-coil-helix-coiled-coil-helix domain containing 3a isoform X2 [Hippoglossus stenolepis]
MGANNSTRRVSFESDENENISVVKGIRLSENVLNRMREPAAPPKKQQRAPTRPPPLEPTLTSSPLLRPLPPPFDPITSLPPPPPLVEPVAPPAPPPPAPLATETVATPPPPPPPQPPAEQVAAPTIADMVLPSSSLPTLLPAPPAPAPCTASAAVEELAVLASPPLVIEPSPPPPPPPPINQPIAASAPVMEAIAPPQVIESIESIESIAPAFVSEPITCPSPVEMEPMAAPPPPQSEPLSFPPILEPALTLPPLPPPSVDTLSLQPAEPLASPPMPEFTSPCEPVAPPPQLPVEPVPAAPVPEPVAVPESIPVPPPPPPPAVDEEALRKKISVELHKGFEEERAKAEQELQAWLDLEKTRAAEQANADAQSQVHSEVSRILSVERAVVQENLQQALLRERIATEDEMLRAQIYAKQLEAREADLKKQDVFYREQVARLEERSAQFYKVTTENYHKSADQVKAKFKRYEMYPVCTDLQGQILACYKENVGKTLHCSNIAALYLQCVNNSKQNDKHVHAPSWRDDITS